VPALPAHATQRSRSTALHSGCFGKLSFDRFVQGLRALRALLRSRPRESRAEATLPRNLCQEQGGASRGLRRHIAPCGACSMWRSQVLETRAC